jgi:hypothetical protein
VVGTVWIKLDETNDGTFDDSTTTADDDESIEMTAELGNDETKLAGTTTGDDHVVGTATVNGT